MRAASEDQIKLEVLHSWIEVLFHDRAQPMDLVYKKNVMLLEVGQYSGKIFALHRRSAGDMEIHPHLRGHDVSHRGFGPVPEGRKGEGGPRPPPAVWPL